MREIERERRERERREMRRREEREERERNSLANPSLACSSLYVVFQSLSWKCSWEGCLQPRGSVLLSSKQ